MVGLALNSPTAFIGEDGEEFRKLLSDKVVIYFFAAPSFVILTIFSQIVFMFSKEDHIRVLNTLERIARHYPPFLDEFMLHVFSQLRRFRGELRVIALSLINRRVEHLPDAFKQLQPRLKDLIVHRYIEDTMFIICLND